MWSLLSSNCEQVSNTFRGMHPLASAKRHLWKDWGICQECFPSSASNITVTVQHGSCGLKNQYLIGKLLYHRPLRMSDITSCANKGRYFAETQFEMSFGKFCAEPHNQSLGDIRWNLSLDIFINTISSMIRHAICFVFRCQKLVVPRQFHELSDLFLKVGEHSLEMLKNIFANQQAFQPERDVEVSLCMAQRNHWTRFAEATFVLLTKHLHLVWQQVGRTS